MCLASILLYVAAFELMCIVNNLVGINKRIDIHKGNKKFEYEDKKNLVGINGC